MSNLGERKTRLYALQTERERRLFRQRPTTRTDKTVQAAIGVRLKSLYQRFADEDVPDRFKDLLRQLEAADGREGHGVKPADGVDSRQPVVAASGGAGGPIEREES